MGAILIIIAVTISGIGGFVLNAEDVTSCNTDMRYITDVAGAFSGTNADIEIDYNPQTNLTGYSVFSPTSTDITVNTIHGINYTKTNANGYWIQENIGNVSNSIVTLTNNKSTSVQNPGTASIQWDNHTATDVTIEEKYGLTGNTVTQITIGDLTFSRVVAIPLSSYMSTYFGTWNTDNVSLSFANTSNSFPCFIVGAGWNDHRVGNGMTGYYSYEITYTGLATEIKANPTTATATINGSDYSYSDIMVVWGGESTVATMNVYIGAAATTYYVDPSQGVQPTSVHTSNLEIVTTTSNSQAVSGTIGAATSPPMGNTITVEGEITLWFGVDSSILSVKVLEYKIERYTQQGHLYINGEDKGLTKGSLTWSWTLSDSTHFHYSYTKNTDDVVNVTLDVSGLSQSSIQEYGGVTKVDCTMSQDNYTSGSNARSSMNIISNDTAGTTNTVISSDNSFSTVTTSTHTETVTRDYDTTYWQNGYHNTSVSMLIPKANNVGNSFNIWTMGVSSTSATGVNVDYENGTWTLNVGSDFNCGNWPAIMVYMEIVEGKLEVSVVPVQSFTNYLDYTLVQNIKYTVYTSSNSDYKYIAYLSFPTTDTQFYHEIVDTVVLLEGGGLYTQDGMFSPAISFPNDTLIEFKVMSAAHFGDSMTIITGNSSPNSITLTADADGYWTYNSKSYKMADVSIYYADTSVESVGIGGITYDGGIYINNQFYEKGHLYIQFGKNADLTDLGVSNKAWSVTLNGTWAVATAYYTGSNVADSYTTWSEPGTWQWSQEEFLMVFIGTMLVGLILCAWKFEMNVIDWIISVGSIILVYILLGGI